MTRVAHLLALALLAGCSSRPPPIPIGSLARDASVRDPIMPALTGGGGGSTGPRSSPPVGDCQARALVVFDRSGSMASEWADGEPRWRVAATALERAIEPLADRLVVGAIRFPSTSDLDRVCTPVDAIEAQLPYRGGRDFLAAWSALWERPEVFGATPIDAAFDAADAALPRDSAVTVVLLLTDGEPTCSGPVPARERAAEWHADGIDTFVVGLPGAHGSAWLDEVAVAGGTGAALDVGDPETLTERLGAVLDAALEQACAP